MKLKGRAQVDIDSTRSIEAFVVVLYQDWVVVKVELERELKSCGFKELGHGAATL
jgi:hypothetical protein